jgi:hypothetical protein
MVYIALTCRCLVGIIFAVSAFSKLRSGSAFRAFAAWLADFGLPLAGRGSAVVLAGAEAALVPLITLPWTAAAGLALAAGAAALFAAGTLMIVRRGAKVSCRCFGASAAPLGLAHVARDAVLCVAAAVGAAGAGSAGARAPGIVLSVVVAVVLAAFVLFLDDLTELFAHPALASGHDAAGD